VTEEIYYRSFKRTRSISQQRYDQHLERIRAEKRREQKGAIGLTIFLVVIITLSILTADKVNNKFSETVSNVRGLELQSPGAR